MNDGRRASFVSHAIRRCVSSSAQGVGAGPTDTAPYGESTRGVEVEAAVLEGVSSLTVQRTAQGLAATAFPYGD